MNQPMQTVSTQTPKGVEQQAPLPQLRLSVQQFAGTPSQGVNFSATITVSGSSDPSLLQGLGFSSHYTGGVEVSLKEDKTGIHARMVGTEWVEVVEPCIRWERSRDEGDSFNQVKNPVACLDRRDVRSNEVVEQLTPDAFAILYSGLETAAQGGDTQADQLLSMLNDKFPDLVTTAREWQRTRIEQELERLRQASAALSKSLAILTPGEPSPTETLTMPSPTQL